MPYMDLVPPTPAVSGGHLGSCEREGIIVDLFGQRRPFPGEVGQPRCRLLSKQTQGVEAASGRNTHHS